EDLGRHQTGAIVEGPRPAVAAALPVLDRLAIDAKTGDLHLVVACVVAGGPAMYAGVLADHRPAVEAKVSRLHHVAALVVPLRPAVVVPVRVEVGAPQHGETGHLQRPPIPVLALPEMEVAVGIGLPVGRLLQVALRVVTLPDARGPLGAVGRLAVDAEH